MVLKAAGHPLTATEVRAQLTAMGFDLSHYANDLSSIHIVLKRLTRAGEAQCRARAWGKPGYQWDDSSKAPGKRVITSGAGKARALRKRQTGEGLCPPKDRKK